MPPLMRGTASRLGTASPTTCRSGCATTGTLSSRWRRCPSKRRCACLPSTRSTWLHRVSCEGFWRDCPDCQWADLRCNQELSGVEAVLDKHHPDLVRRTREVFEAAMAQKAHLPTTATSVQHH